ncbi:phage terminase small subunit [Microbulbifer sp. VAAF005]|uniref:phage terminase small subunit n=1 Tax=Microbulbifer sp. VAAF005 TaxID=3034230 RepID=UPI0024AE48B6|nr:phage terminase small subunit [Microbulbifer sp. VAAF005]WHI45029.1 phage terminase small subunit [Microbulbifer sp. VAAF005]
MPFITVAHQNKCKAKAAKEKAEQQALENHAVLFADNIAPQSAPTNVEDSAASHEVIEVSLDRDLELLKERTNIADKVDLKRQLLPKYLPFVKKYRESGEHYKNLVLVYCTLWAMDVEDIELALDLAKFAVEQQQKLPHYFKSDDLQTFVAESLHDWALKQYKNNTTASPYFDEVLELVTNNSWPIINTIVLGKLYKMAGLFAEKAGDQESAFKWYHSAEEANPRKAGVKTRLEALAKKLNKPL